MYQSVLKKGYETGDIKQGIRLIQQNCNTVLYKVSFRLELPYFFDFEGKSRKVSCFV
jgi:hypothetical protein